MEKVAIIEVVTGFVLLATVFAVGMIRAKAVARK